VCEYAYAASAHAVCKESTTESLLAKRAKRRPTRRWVRTVTTDSTHPPPRTFAGSASQIARTMARKDISPKGLGSAIRMIQYFINRGGHRLTASRRRELERAKRILRKRRQSAG
jgi:hypothetical protein